MDQQSNRDIASDWWKVDEVELPLTAPNRSAVIRTRLWIDTNVEKSVRKGCTLHKAWPRLPPIGQEVTCNPVRRTGLRNIGKSRSDIAIFAISIFIGLLKVVVLWLITWHDERISNPRTKKNQVVSDGLSNFVCYCIYQSGAAPGTCSIRCCVHAYWHLNKCVLLSLSCFQKFLPFCSNSAYIYYLFNGGFRSGPRGPFPPFVQEFFSFADMYRRVVRALLLK